MKVEFGNTSVYFRGSAFNEFKTKVPYRVPVPVVEQIPVQVPQKVTIPPQVSDSVVISNIVSAVCSTVGRGTFSALPPKG